MNERIEELAALHAAGALEGAELAEWQQLTQDSGPAVTEQLSRFQDAVALAAVFLAAPVNPPADLKGRILSEIASREKQFAAAPLAEPTHDLSGFKFIFGKDSSDWINLRVPGASVKLLSMDSQRGYAVVLGKLAPGARYPEHRHIHAEQVFVVSGDLHIGDRRLDAGDFHHADAGTFHGENYSETGCTILAVISTADLEAQMV